MTDLAAALAAVALWLFLLARARRILADTPVISASAPGPVLASVSPSVSVFVPARNEESSIGLCVESIDAQDRAVSVVVVIDDRSTDGTREALRIEEGRVERLVVIEGDGPGEGECGKPAALWAAITKYGPKTEWLLFVDADVVLAPAALDGMLQLAAERRADLVSLLPSIQMKSPLDLIVMPSVLSLVMARYPPSSVSNPTCSIAFANGQLMLIRRSVYEAVGGHASVASEILEDVRLAERVKASGGKLVVADGRSVATTHMYESFDELVEGWSKNLFLLVGGNVVTAMGYVLGLLVLGWMAPILAVSLGSLLGWIAYGSILAIQIRVRQLGRFTAWWAVLSPVGATITAWLILRSLYLHRMKRRVVWKGRVTTTTVPRG